MTQQPDITIITVAFKSREFIRELLKSTIAAQNNLTIEYFIIDNASGDGLFDMIKEEFPTINSEKFTLHCIQNTVNLGFAKANNIGIKQAKGRYILLLNPDMRLFSDTLTNMVAWMDNRPTAGIAGCRLEAQDGTLVPHVRRFPTLSDQLAILLKIPRVFPSVLNSYLARDFDYDTEAHVDSIRGSFFMIRPSTVERIGCLDERYFIWFEEVDYCKSARAAGIEVWYTPNARCIDFIGRSFSLVEGYTRQRYITESMVKYFRKWHPRSAWIIAAVRPVILALAWMYAKLFVWPTSASNS